MHPPRKGYGRGDRRENNYTVWMATGVKTVKTGGEQQEGEQSGRVEGNSRLRPVFGRHIFGEHL
jgi:hypothetical protein